MSDDVIERQSWQKSPNLEPRQVKVRYRDSPGGPAMRSDDPYETDFHRWALEQAQLLRVGYLPAADLEHIAEELEGLAKRHEKELVSHLTRLLTHLLKWWRQPDFRGKSWRLSIENARIDIREHLEENPSLQPFFHKVVPKAYRRAREKAVKETGLDERVFPMKCPWEYVDLMDEGFWPPLPR